MVSIGLKYLSQLDFDTRTTGVAGLMSRQMPILFNEIIQSDIIEDSTSPEFKIIELYALSPWLFLQKDQVLFVNIMDYLSSIISRTTQSHFSISHSKITPFTNHHATTTTTTDSNSSSSLIIQAVDENSSSTTSTTINDSDLSTLLHYSQLFLSVIRPVFSLHIELSKYYLELYSNSNLNQDQKQEEQEQEQVELISTKSCLRPNQLEFSFIENVTKIFINSMKWNCNNDLESIRLEILSFLFCQQLLLEEELEQEESEGEENSHHKNDNFITDLLFIYGKDLFRYVFTVTLAPSSSIIIRKKTIEFILYIIQRYSNHKNLRVVSFKKKQTQNLKSTKEQHQEQEKEFFTSEMIQRILNLLLTTSLDDSCDSIRVITLEILLYLVPYIENNETQQKQQQQLTTTTTTTNITIKNYTFETIVDYLLHRCLDGNPTKDVLLNLDMVLRSLAILDPITFELIVRSKFSLLNGIHKPPSDASEIFSGLIDHSSLLVQFQQLEM